MMDTIDWGALVGPIIAAVLSGGLISALVTFVQNRWLEKKRADEAERDRLRKAFAEAFAVYADYKEFPYLIRRRRADCPEAERARLTSQLNSVQSKLSYYRAWTAFESPTVGDAYCALLGEMRKLVGGAMHQAWQDAPAQEDRDMNISRTVIDLQALIPLEDAFIAAVSARMRTLTPRRLRRK